MLLIGCAGFALLTLAWADGPPLWWVMRGSHIEKAVVRWDKQKVEIRDAQQVQEFYQAVLSGSSPLPYPTRCLPDDHPENWSVTFIRSGRPPFQVQVGTDTCGTYKSRELMPLIKKRLNVA